MSDRTIALIKSKYCILDGTDMVAAEIYEIIQKLGTSMRDFRTAF
jgi:hypothetical protein